VLQRLPLSARRLLAALLAAAACGYSALLVTTYLQTTAPSELGPSLGELNRLLFPTTEAISPMQRRLEAADTPLGAGPLITGRPLDQYSELAPSELAQREAERQALLDWIRSGASRSAYESDDYPVSHAAAVASITPELLVHSATSNNRPAAPHVRIHTLINERCLSCHSEDGDVTARLIPFDNYLAISRYLIPDDHTARPRAWLLAALFSLFPLVALTGLSFAFTSHPLAARKKLLALTIAALIAFLASGLIGSFVVLLPAFFVALICVMVQILATMAELAGIQPNQGRREPSSASILRHGHA
jgi:hypothetical protein